MAPKPAASSKKRKKQQQKLKNREEQFEGGAGNKSSLKVPNSIKRTPVNRMLEMEETATIEANTSSTKSPRADLSSSDESSSDDDLINEAAAKTKRKITPNAARLVVAEPPATVVQVFLAFAPAPGTAPRFKPEALSVAVSVRKLTSLEAFKGSILKAIEKAAKRLGEPNTTCKLPPPI